jgi:hypothetical protein
VPLPASQLDAEEFLRLMVEAPSKLGKTRSVGASLISAFGMIYVIQCGTASSMDPLKRISKKFEYDIIRDESQMENAIREARKSVKEGKYKAIFLDDFNLYASYLQMELENQSRNQKGEADGRKFWPEYHKRLANTVQRLMDIKAHFVMTCHPGAFMGKSANEIPGTFTDVVVLDNEKGNRVFLLNSENTPGRACRSIDREEKIEADCGKLWNLFQEVARGPKVTKR